MTANTPHTLVATAQELSDLVAMNGMKHRPPTPRAIGAWLSNMTGVHRLRVDPKRPNQCGVISAQINGVTYSGRLWALAETTADGRRWTSLTEAEVIALWKNLAPPRNASVHQHPQSKAAGGFPDDGEAV